MSFFLAILPLVIVSLLMLPAMAAGGTGRAAAPRTTPGRTPEGASLSGLY